MSCLVERLQHGPKTTAVSLNNPSLPAEGTSMPVPTGSKAEVSRGCMGREKARLWTWVQILAPLSVNCVCDLGPLLNVSELLTSKMGIIK